MSGLLSSALTEGRSYQRAWVIFRQFCAQFYGSTKPTLPLSPVCLPLYISYLSFRKLAYSTITLHLSAISYAHKLGGLCDPSKSFLIQKLLTALSRQRHSDIRLPITLCMSSSGPSNTLTLRLSNALYSQPCFLLLFMDFFELASFRPRAPALRVQLSNIMICKFYHVKATPARLRSLILIKHNPDHRPLIS